jgi:F-type H+-transporting ATPase subunit epsilon
MRCIVVTPEKTILDEPAEFVALPLFDGEIGIAPRHSPMIGRLGCGEMRIGHRDEAVRFYVDGGFVEVLDDVVSVLTSQAVPADQLDAAAVRGQLAAARKRPATTPEELAVRQRLEAQARAQLQIAERCGNP